MAAQYYKLDKPHIGIVVPLNQMETRVIRLLFSSPKSTEMCLAARFQLRPAEELKCSFKTQLAAKVGEKGKVDKKNGHDVKDRGEKQRDRSMPPQHFETCCYPQHGPRLNIATNCQPANLIFQDELT